MPRKIRRNRKISNESIIWLIQYKVKDVYKYVRRQDDFKLWINHFIKDAKRRRSYPKNARLMGGANVHEVSVALNFHYWSCIEEYMRPNLLKKPNPEESRLNRYKIAAVIEYIVMREGPFENTKRPYKPLVDLNARFCIFLVSQLLLAWEYPGEKKDKLPVNKNIHNNKNIMEYIDEHKVWLSKHILCHQGVVYSSMQTIRLFHCLLHAKIDRRFIPYKTHK